MTESSTSSIVAWFSGRLPAEWAATAPQIAVDRDEITVVVAIDEPTVGTDGGSAADRAEAAAGRAAAFREDSREQRMAIAREAEHRFERKVSWGVTIGDRSEMFTHLAAPVMTRLRQPERRVLDTLISANVARSRSDALAWCVRLVGSNADAWLSELRSALEDVERLRSQGPDAASPDAARDA